MRQVDARRAAISKVGLANDHEHLLIVPIAIQDSVQDDESRTIWYEKCVHLFFPVFNGIFIINTIIWRILTLLRIGTIAIGEYRVLLFL